MASLTEFIVMQPPMSAAALPQSLSSMVLYVADSKLHKKFSACKVYADVSMGAFISICQRPALNDTIKVLCQATAMSRGQRLAYHELWFGIALQLH